ncbi:hypothetical protein [Alkaliphilus serpentinus]|uniref:DUF2140 family protein n=1 Tax=Alkaliphilus serpentinus TaxID=1482731 RepID=A0A833MDN8_9FIRM|nr:hypothetical protein [Alkaliphilus serpentinus]KAB3529220.1 hypothetical protein F8153_09860 [Alkaliphilus serpentinus]
MKRFVIILLTLLLSFVVISVTLLYSPLPAPEISTEIVYDVDYFINKISSDNLQLFEKNKYVITEEELNGYIHQHFTEIALNQSPNSFSLEAIDLRLNEDEILLLIYGKYSILPVKLQVTLVPFHNKEANTLAMVVADVKISRLKLPPTVVKRILKEEYLTEGYLIPLEGPENIIINHIQFGYKAISIYYSIDKAGVMESLLKSLFGK